METQIHKPQKTTDIFRALKIGVPIQIVMSHTNAPHSIARLVGIRVSIRTVEKLKPKGFLLEVTRIKARHNAEVSEGGTRDSRIETAAQSRPSLH